MKNNNLQEKVLDHLLSSSFGYEDTIREIDLARIFGVSVTPVREALNNLEEKGFVERRKRKGTYLKSFSMKEINELYDLRSVLEGLAARLLCGVVATGVIKELKELIEEYDKNKPGRKHSLLSDIDYRFHSLIVDSCKNERLVGFVKDFHVITKTLKGAKRGEYVNEIAFQSPFTHLKIVEAIENRDAEKAENVARNHVDWAKENTIKVMLAEGIERLGMAK